MWSVVGPGMDIGIAAFLRAGWIVGTLPILIALVPSYWFNSLHDAILGLAKRGKIMQSSPNKLTVPQRFFFHFYVVAVVWTTFLVVATWFYAYQMAPLVSEPLLYPTITTHLTGGSQIFSLHRTQLAAARESYQIWQSVLLLLLMEVQVVRRLVETIYIFKYSPKARMHIFGYLTGLFYYVAAPLSLCSKFAPDVFNFVANKMVEFIVNGRNHMEAAEVDLWGIVNPLLKLRWYSWIGMAIFIWGWIHQRRCHAILGSLRKNRTQDDEYVIPDGDWFRYVSSPHYLAEIVIYAGLLVVSGGTDLTIWLLFGFVVANLAFVAAETHRWYNQKFEDYPSNKFAIIPFVY